LSNDEGPPPGNGYGTLNELIRGDVEEVGREAGGGDDQAKTRDQKDSRNTIPRIS
jgi:hypothetical protein